MAATPTPTILAPHVSCFAVGSSAEAYVAWDFTATLQNLQTEKLAAVWLCGGTLMDDSINNSCTVKLNIAGDGKASPELGGRITDKADASGPVHDAVSTSII